MNEQISSDKKNRIEGFVKTRLRRIISFTIIWWLYVLLSTVFYALFIHDVGSGFWFAGTSLGYFLAIIFFVLIDAILRKLEKPKNFLITVCVAFALTPLWGRASIYLYEQVVKIWS